MATAPVEKNMATAPVEEKKKKPQTDVVYADEFDIFCEKQFEKWVLPFVPRVVAPNALSMLNLVSRLACFALAVVAMGAATCSPDRVYYGAGCTLAVLAGWMLDYLDGMQARRTNRCSTLGHALDHWVDSFGITLTAAAYAMVFQADHATLALTVPGAALIFYLQIVAWNHSPGRVWAHPRIGGATGQVAIIASFAVIFASDHLCMRQHWLPILYMGIITHSGNVGYLVNIVHFGAMLREWGKLGAALSGVYVFVSLGATMLYLHGGNVLEELTFTSDLVGASLPGANVGSVVELWWNPVSFCIFSSAASLRMNGSHILSVLSDRPVSLDLPCVVWTTLLVGSCFLGHDLPVWLPYFASGTLVVLGVRDFAAFANSPAGQG